LIPYLSEAATLAAQAPKLEEHYFEILFGLGGMILLVAWLPIILKKMPLSLPIVCVAIGAALFSFEPFSTWAPHPDKTPTLVERAAELIVIVSLMGAGLKIERAVGWKSWNMTWRLLGIAMPITIALVKDVIWKLGAGVALGAGLGWLIGWIIYRLPRGTRLCRGRETASSRSAPRWSCTPAWRSHTVTAFWRSSLPAC